MTSETIRLWCAKNIALRDQVTGNLPQFFIGSSVSFEVGIGQENSYTPATVTDFASLTLEIYSIDKGTKYLTKTVLAASFGTCTEASWKAQTGQHATFTFTSSELGLTDNDFWLVVFGTTVGGETIIFVGGKIRSVNSGAYPTGGTAVINNPYQIPYLLLLCPDDGTYHKVYARLDQGQYTLEIDQSATP
jgi:hypothetical protein